MAKIIPDIYHGDTIRSWKELPDQVEFIVMKASQGEHLDSKVIERIKKAEIYGVPYWLYVYLERGNEVSQAKFMYEKTKDVIGTFFVGYVIDAEEGNTAYNVKKALRFIEDLNYKSMLYCGYGTGYTIYKDIIKEKGVNTAYWEARYGANDGKCHSNTHPPHLLCDLLQYTDRGTTDIILNKCDLNVVTGNGKSLDWFKCPIPKKEEYRGPVPNLIEHKLYYISIGDSGEDVKALQQILLFINENLGSSGADGVFGNLTKQAVISVQGMLNLTKTGIVDRDTLDAILKYIEK